MISTVRHTRVPPSPCPHCGSELSYASGTDFATPSIGDYSICLLCNGLSQYTLGLALMKRDIDEVPAGGRQMVCKMKTAASEVRRKTGLKGKKQKGKRRKKRKPSEGFS